MISLAADGTLRLAPSDLAAHLACPHLTQLAAALQHEEIPPPPERENAQAELIARKGDEHEAAFLATLREQGREVVEIGFGNDGLGAAASHLASGTFEELRHQGSSSPSKSRPASAAISRQRPQKARTSTCPWAGER